MYVYNIRLKVFFCKLHFQFNGDFLSDETSSAKGEGLKWMVWLIDHSAKVSFIAVIYMVMNLLSFIMTLYYISAGEFPTILQLISLNNSVVSCYSWNSPFDG